MFRPAALFFVAALAVAGCSDDGEPSDTTDPGQESIDDVVDPGDGDESSDSDVAAPTTTEPSPLDPTQIPGEPINQFNLRVRDCFDQIEDRRDGEPITITTRLPCDEAHHFEVFAQLTYPAEHPSVFPGDSVVRDYALQSCYREFTTWVGSDYETSELDIGVIIPNQQNFENDAARYRGIYCWLDRVDGDPMIGTSRNSGW